MEDIEVNITHPVNSSNNKRKFDNQKYVCKKLIVIYKL